MASLGRVFQGGGVRVKGEQPPWGAAPVVWCCTCCVALHPNRRGVVLTDRVYCCLCCGCCGGVWWRVVLRCGPMFPLGFRAVVHPLCSAAPIT